MTMKAPTVAICVLAFVFAALFPPRPAWSLPGTVLSYQKISDTQGAFTATLDDLDEFGGATVGLGDLDGPGPSVSALAVGSAFDDDGGTDRGAVYILFLASTGNVLSYQKISDTSGSFPAAQLGNADEFGSSLAFLGDLDGPGPSVAALAVGATGDDDGGSNRGAVYILFLASTGSVLSAQKISDVAGNFTATLVNLDEFGAALAHLGDLDGAGASVAALAVGATFDDDGGIDQGAVYILFLAASGNVLTYQKISETSGNFTGTLDTLDDFGTSLAGLGDLDGVGPSVAALAVGAAADDDGGLDRGAVYVLFLAATGNVLSHQKISDTQGNFTEILSDVDEFGGALGHVGDLDGSNPAVTSLAVGTAGDDDGGEDRGAVYVLFLAGTGSVLSSQKISDFYGNFTEPLGNSDAFGSCVAALGDLDGAGPSVMAMAVGAPADDDGSFAIDRGAVYVLFLDGNPTTGVSPHLPPASGITLGRARPNPFHPNTVIPFRLTEGAHVRIDVCDVHGRLVRTLVRQEAGPGEHRATWDGRDDSGRALPPGTYLYRLAVNGRVVTSAEKALLLR